MNTANIQEKKIVSETPTIVTVMKPRSEITEAEKRRTASLNGNRVFSILR